MSAQSRTVCDECRGIIPDGAASIQKVAMTVQTGTGAENFPALDFCSTAHMVAYLQALPLIAVPATAYPVLA